MLFSGSNFYPSGGWEDFVGFYDDLESAKNALIKLEHDSSFKWAHFVKDEKIVLFAYPEQKDDFLSSHKWEFHEPD